MNIPGDNIEEVQESLPQIQRAKAVLELLGNKASEAKLFVPEEKADPIVGLQLDYRKLEFYGDTIGDEEYAGKIAYGKYGATHYYGLFASDEHQAAADYLLNPNIPPRSITAAVNKIKNGLIADGISQECITVEWPDRVDQPIIKQSGQPNRELRFGLASPGTINAYENGNDQGLTDGKGATRFLQGLWYNEGNWDNEYEKMPDGNYRKKEG